MIFPVPTEDLSVNRIRKAIEDACAKTNERLSGGIILRVGTVDDISALLALVKDPENANEQIIRDFDLFHSIVLEQRNKIVGFAIVYWAYSTWDGRYLYVNKITAPNTSMEISLMYTLAEVAVRLEGQRLVWQHYQDKSPLYKSLGAEPLDGWLTLRMSTEGMDSFLSSRTMLSSSETKATTANHSVEESILEALKASESEEVQLQLATENDLHHIERLVHGLAVYEKEVEAIHINQEHYHVDGFHGDSPLYKCLLLQNKKEEHCCGMAFFYFGYDVGKGRFLYLEDLFIEELYRGNGGGSLIMATLASIAKSVGCTGFVWQALDWNTPALNFYDKIGAKVLDGLLTTRFSGEALKAFVDNRPSHV